MLVYTWLLGVQMVMKRHENECDAMRWEGGGIGLEAEERSAEIQNSCGIFRFTWEIGASS